MGGLLACPGCARLTHGRQLESLARDAEAAERAGDRTTALGAWRRAIELLPTHSAQHDQIAARMKALSAAIDGRAPQAKGKAGKAAAGAGAVGLVLLKSKALLALVAGNAKLLLVGLTKLPTLLSMLFYFRYVRWWSGEGIGFALGLIASIYVHEIGHVATLKRYGIEASSPMFIPGFGALVRLKQYPTDAHEDARTGLAGPMWGLAAAVVAAIVGVAFALPVATSVASLGATINLFNLIPVWQLDGSRGLRALSRNERLVVAAAALAMAIGFHQWMPALVGVVAIARAFEASAHPEGDRRMAVLFVVLVVAHAVLASRPMTILGWT